MRVVSLQYRYDFPQSFEVYRNKITQIVAQQASRGTQLLVFPEYAGLEMLSFAPAEKVYDYHAAYVELFAALSHRHQMLICSGSHLVKVGEKDFNRSYLFSPSHKMSYQDKCVLTPGEVEEGSIAHGDHLCVFETPWCKVAICICYDVEFPPLAKHCVEAGAQLILVPSYTSSMHGFYRVWTGCRARALENQCYVVQSALVGQTDLEIAYGAAGACSPIDEPFPEDGILELGEKNVIGFVSATLDFTLLETVRKKGQTHNYIDGQRLKERALPIHSFDLR
jgi:predicted amidohydrolase